MSTKKEGLSASSEGETPKVEQKLSQKPVKPAETKTKTVTPSVAFQEGSHYLYYGPSVAIISAEGEYIQASQNQIRALPVPENWIPEMKAATALDLQDAGTAMHNVISKQDPHWAKYKAVEDAVNLMVNGG